MEDISIVKATPADVETLQKVGIQTFTETFAEHNSAQNMATYLEASFSSQKLTEELTDAGAEFYFAVLTDEVIGYLKVNTGTSQTELQDNNALEIERIYVSKAYHGKKVGQLLYDYALHLAETRKLAYIWLGVWEHNIRALRFYEKNGFVPFDKHVFKLGDDVQTDIMMKKMLN